MCMCMCWNALGVKLQLFCEPWMWKVGTKHWTWPSETTWCFPTVYLFLWTYVCVLVWIYMHHMNTGAWGRSRRGHCKWSYRWLCGSCCSLWELNPGPLRERQVFLTLNYLANPCLLMGLQMVASSDFNICDNIFQSKGKKENKTNKQKPWTELIEHRARNLPGKIHPGHPGLAESLDQRHAMEF